MLFNRRTNSRSPYSLIHALLVLGLAAGSTILSLACSSNEGTSVPQERRDLPGDFPLEAPRWISCPLTPGSSSIPAECTSVTVPQDWQNHALGTLEVFMRRLPVAASTEPQGQLWLLHGGPGGSSEELEFLAGFLRDVAPQWTLYLVDHRGAGRSARLGCPGIEDDEGALWPATTPDDVATCFDALRSRWGEGLAFFNTTQAAYDLGALIELNQNAEQKAFVFGRGAGTIWANEYLRLFPEQPAGVILDGPWLPDGSLASEWSPRYDQVAQNLLQVCSDNTLCQEKLGNQPDAVLADLLDRMRTGHCSELADTPEEEENKELLVDRLRTTFARLLPNRILRSYIPALIYRLSRCEREDVSVYRRFMGAVESARVPRTIPFSQPLNFLIHRANISSRFQPEERDATRFADLSVTPMTEQFYAAFWEVVPLYELPDEALAWAESNRPVLILWGQMNPTVLPSGLERAQAHFSLPQHAVVQLPYGHAEPFDKGPPPERKPSCATQLLLQFLNNPSSSLDRSCLDQIAPPTFDGTTADRPLFGEQEIWEN